LYLFFCILWLRSPGACSNVLLRIRIPAVLGNILDDAHYETITAAAVLVHKFHCILNIVEPGRAAKHKRLLRKGTEIIPRLRNSCRIICILEHLSLIGRHTGQGGKVTTIRNRHCWKCKKRKDRKVAHTLNKHNIYRFQFFST